MSLRKKVLGNIFQIVRDQFWPFILFWLAILLIRFHPLGGLISLAFINGEWAVRFWIASDYSYFTAFSVCVLCANIDLAMWFWFFNKGRFLLEYHYPKAGRWFVKKFDLRQYDFSEHDGKFRHFLRGFARKLVEISSKHPRSGLFLMGTTPFCGIIVGVPTAVGYRAKYGYLLIALGNTMKIVIFGFVIANRIILAGLIVLVLLWVLLFKKPRKV